jgi:hypothetical protein
MTVETQIFLTQKSRVQGLRARAGIVSLLARPESNPKLAKGRKLGVMSAPLHLAPADLSGYEVCAKRTDGCTAACLHTAGNPAHMEGKTRARIARTKLYFEDRAFFMSALISEVSALESKAQRAGMICGVRLNATSDIPFERVKIKHLGKTYDNIMELFPDVQFYDYTKRPNRRNLPPNYHLTFSLAEDNDADALNAAMHCPTCLWIDRSLTATCTTTGLLMHPASLLDCALKAEPCTIDRASFGPLDIIKRYYTLKTGDQIAGFFYGDENNDR